MNKVLGMEIDSTYSVLKIEHPMTLIGRSIKYLTNNEMVEYLVPFIEDILYLKDLDDSRSVLNVVNKYI